MNEIKDIPYIAFESSQARLERVNKRLWIVILVLVVALVGTNVGWLIWENQWQYVDTTTVTQDVDAQSDGNGNLNVNTAGGDLNVGKSESDSNSVTD